MSTSTPAPSNAGPAPVKAHTGTQHATKKAGGEAPADLFSSLMSLVSATHGEPAAAGPAPDTSSDAREETPGDPRQPGADNPVYALLNWASPAALAATAANNAALAGDTATAARTTLAGQRSVTTEGMALAGMTPLSASAPLDADTAAALALASAPSAKPGAGEAAEAAAQSMGSEGLRTAAPGRTDTAHALGAPTATSNGTWRKTPAHASATAAHETGSLRALAADGLAARLGVQAPMVRSTVAMHERLGQTATPLAGAAGEASPLGTPGLRPAGAPTGEATAATPGAAVSELLDGGTPRDLLNAEDATQALAQPDPLASPDREAELISHWSAQNLRHASLRVGQSGEDAIDIRLSMSGQEVRVDFRTDNAEARASLQQSAGESLGEMLQRSGIQLGDVSVGAQGQRQDGGAERREAGPGNARRPTEPDAEPKATPAMSRPRADGSQPLDVFA
ncbi:flagellar hook-length control protein FliK [Hydrogenophaga sp.]|uniref:flagellar hook-length control protein FliK n=1 Tax=Hydrogenophaga sp. TaxID=1904254 RepID=UPI003F6A87E3